MSQRSMTSRRSFIKIAGGALAFPTIISSRVLGASAPSNTLLVGMIGVGDMGTGDMRNFLRDNRVRVVSVCDVDRNHVNRAKGIADEAYNSNDCRAYHDYREMLGREDLDIVSTALPDHWHALPAIAAAKAGCDIYGQKPMARSIRDGRAMCDAVERYGRIWQTGSQQRSSQNFRFACELVLNGFIGDVHRVEVGLPNGSPGGSTQVQPVPNHVDWDFWLGPAPKRPYQGFGPHWQWRWIMDYSGGQLTDWCGHHVDIAHWGLGLDNTGPIEIEGVGEYPSTGLYDVPTAYDITCKYRDGAGLNTAKGGVEMSITNNSINPQGTRWIGEKGWVFVRRGHIDANPKSLLRQQIGANDIQLQHSTSHYRNFVDSVISRNQPLCPAETGHRSISVGLLGEIAMLLGRKIRWNPDTEEIIGDQGASNLLGRAYREPWVLS